MDRMANTLKNIASLLQYSMNDIDWEFEDLTDHEQAIIESPENLEEIRKFAEAQGIDTHRCCGCREGCKPSLAPH